MQHPKDPGGQPSITLSSRYDQDLFLQELSQNRALIPLIDACDCNSQLEILQLVEADVDRIAKVISKQKESCGVC
jgi:hypothetical protein